MNGAMRILVTGANGQVGYELLRALANASPSVRLPEEGGSSHPLRNEGRLEEPSAERCAQRGGMASRAARGDDAASSKSHPPRSPFLWKGEESTIIPATRDGKLANGGECECVDLADLAGLDQALNRIAPDLIINAAAYTAVDRAEDEPELAQCINADAVGALGAWAVQHAARVVHYSTDYVFDGTATQPYREDGATHPLGVYGRTKLAGEIALRDSGARHLIFRTAWVYAARGKNFLRTMLRVGAERDELRVVDDQIGAPTSARLIADVTAQAIDRWYGAGDDASRKLDGVYHLVASGQTSWCGFARAIFGRASRVGLLAQTPQVTPITTADYPTRATRPAYSVLDTTKLRSVFGVELPDWQTALDDVMGELKIAGP